MARQAPQELLYYREHNFPGGSFMSYQEQIDRWTSEVSTHLPHLSKCQAVVLALWSYGMVLARSCALNAVLLILAPLLGCKENTLRQRLREWCYDATDKRGSKRQQVEVTSCFAPLLKWILSLWHSKQLAIVLDATTLGDRFVVLAISVVYGGCAIPVAWTILVGNTPHSWRGEWLRMLSLLKPAMPETMEVIVLTDRGLYARWLYRHIIKLGWHPFMRIKAGAKFRPANTGYFRWLSSFAPEPGSCWSGQGTAFSSSDRRLNCTLLALWEEGCSQPWFILTDLLPEDSNATWYSLRAWIEQGFKTIKRGGWQWNRTRMTDPNRASRLWLAIAVSTLWMLSVGTEADLAISESILPDLSDILYHTKRQRRITRTRLVSLFRRGWVCVIVALLKGNPLPLPAQFKPNPWHAPPQYNILDNLTKEAPFKLAA